MIIIIDILGPARGDDEPEILSRIIDHARSGRDVRKKARRILAGVDSIGARGVRVLDRDGTQIFSHHLAATPTVRARLDDHHPVKA